MVGGSVSGRPFRDDPTSYSKTGIPCGHPSRYKSRGVTRMIPDDSIPYKNQRLDAPPDDRVQSEADNQLHDMLEKQLSKSINLQKERRDFVGGLVYEDGCQTVSGQLSLNEYRTISTTREEVNYLRNQGLSEEEIRWKFDEDAGPTASKRRRYGTDPRVAQQRIEEIERKIHEKEANVAAADTFINAKRINRQLMDIEKSINRGTDRASKFSHLVKLQSTDGDSCLKAAVASIDSIINSDNSERKYASSDENHNELLSGSRGCQDVDSHKNTIAVPEEIDQRHKDCCSNQDESMSTKNTSIEAPNRIQPLQEEDIVKNRISVEEIRAIDRFSNYYEGELSKVLYLKNLSIKVTEQDLVMLFNRFQQGDQETISCRLMKGKMKGQAFVTFADVKTAQKAFNLINGYQLKGKPIIIQYGRGKKD